MAYNLRWFQQDASDAAINHMTKSLDYAVIDAATGAGKSLLVADVATRMFKLSGGKRILCLAPSAELVVQNREKFLETGQPASMFSASAGAKNLSHPVIFGSPGTVISVAEKIGSDICLIIIDEAHGLTETVKEIIRLIKLANPKVRVLGLTATPYRMGSGYIYKIGHDGKPVGENRARDPFFLKCIYKIGTKQLIAERYLTPARIGVINAAAYETAGIILQSNNKYKSTDTDRAFVGHGRKTAAIVADIVEQSRDKMGVMIFAQTTEHALEIMASLPSALSRMVSGDVKITSKKDRKKIIQDFKARKFKYLVNVAVLTTGFDASHVDVVAMLRLTESISLLQQIIGRGLRLHILKQHAMNWDSYTLEQRIQILEEQGKPEMLFLDYGGNVERHCPDGDLFAPEVKAVYAGSGGAEIKAECELCMAENTFTARKNEDGHKYDKQGYFIDLKGNRIASEFGPVPGHHGRRCQGYVMIRGNGGVATQCGYRWTSKACPTCGEENDIAARYCSQPGCKAEIVNPNDKLAMEFKALKKDPKLQQCDVVTHMSWSPTQTRSGKTNIKVNFETKYRKFTIWLDPAAVTLQREREHAAWAAATSHGQFYPGTVTYKEGKDKFYTVLDYNQPPDELEQNDGFS